jgi:hypothetical protein
LIQVALEEFEPYYILKNQARYGQVKFKTPDHGSAYGLPVNEKGRTPNTEKNALIL